MMLKQSSGVGVFVACVMFLVPSLAQAQYGATPFSDPATGERYHLEAAGEFWNPPLNLQVASEALGRAGDVIDATGDLGLVQKRLMELRIVARPARKHKFRVQYLPMKYNGQSTLHREFIFNNQRFGVNLPLTTAFEWTTWLLAYEYDFLYRDNWFVGLTLNSKFTKVQVDIKSPIVNEFALAQAPIPTIGGIARVYVVPNISITGELNGFKIPDSVSTEYKAHYFDFDLYGTVNFNDYVGAQLGYRSIDVGYTFEQDHGAFVMRGLYFGGVVRY
jgi:hypothetical protein